MSYINVSSLTKSFNQQVNGAQEEVEVLQDITFSVERGEFVTFFGPNGSGKTTLLNIIAGLLDFDSGEITINSKVPGEANIGYIFQNYRESLFPWKNIIDNIAFGKELRGLNKKERRENIRKLLIELGIDIPLNLYPYQLSGGQQQLASIVRALACEPQLLVMDEPFGSLDFQTRMFMQSRLLDLWHKTKTTILFVSHEIDEAILLGDRMILLTKRPAKISGILEINLPRPRDHDMIVSPTFLTLKNKALEIFMNGLK